MKWALVDGLRSLATPGLVGRCPGCGGEVVAKCGEVLQWHWSHRAAECDPWSEPESGWHIAWKNQFPSEWQERVIGPHRADVATPKGVIEFQKSSISTKEIREREAFYGRMLWVIDALDFNLEKAWHLHYRHYDRSNTQPPYFTPEWQEYANERFSYCEKSWEKEPHYRWLWPRKSWLAAKKTILLDRGFDYLLRIKWKSSTGGLLICNKITKEQFIKLVSG